MDRIRIMAGDFAPQVPLKVSEVVHWDGRISLVGAIDQNGWFEKAGTCTLFLPHGSTIKGMTIRGRVAHYDAVFSVFIVRVPNGSHPNHWFDSPYTMDEVILGIHLTPSLNDGYIHHDASRDDVNHTVDLVNNTYMVRVSIHINRDTVRGHIVDAYLTDVEIRYQRPSIISRLFYKARLQLSDYQQVGALGTKRKFEESKISLPSELTK